MKELNITEKKNTSLEKVTQNIPKIFKMFNIVWNDDFQSLYESSVASATKFSTPISKHSITRYLFDNNDDILTFTVDEFETLYQRCVYYAERYNFDNQVIICSDNVALGYDGLKWDIINGDIKSNILVKMPSSKFLEKYSTIEYEDLEYDELEEDGYLVLNESDLDETV